MITQLDDQENKLKIRKKFYISFDKTTRGKPKKALFVGSVVNMIIPVDQCRLKMNQLGFTGREWEESQFSVLAHNSTVKFEHARVLVGS